MKHLFLYGDEKQLTAKYMQYPITLINKIKKLALVTRILDSGVISNASKRSYYAEKFLNMTKELKIPQMFSCIVLGDGEIRVFV